MELNENAKYIFEHLDKYLESTTQLDYPGDVAAALRAHAEIFDEWEAALVEEQDINEEFNHIINGEHE